MSKINKYRDCLIRFIEGKKYLFENGNDESFIGNIRDNIVKHGGYNSILLLTILNNQNRKLNISTFGYLIAIMVEIFDIYLSLIYDKNINDKNDKNINDKNAKKQFYAITHLNNICYKLFIQNIECIKINSIKFNNDKISVVNMFVFCLEYINNLFINAQMHNFVPKISENKCDKTTHDWFIKNCKNKGILSEKFKTIKQLEVSSFNEYIALRYNPVCNASFIIGWAVGSCNSLDSKKIEAYKIISNRFTIIKKIVKDFENLENDILGSNTFTLNYVVNYGFVEAYRVFLENKEKLIEELMVIDASTSTIIEMLNDIEQKLDKIIDETSPDVRTSYSGSSKSIN